MARIDGGIPAIDSKNAKMEGFALRNRKTFPYILQNGLHSPFNRKTSAYFTFDGHLIKDGNSPMIIGETKTSYHRGVSLIVGLFQKKWGSH
jgi:hypothetical protein